MMWAASGRRLPQESSLLHKYRRPLAGNTHSAADFRVGQALFIAKTSGLFLSVGTWGPPSEFHLFRSFVERLSHASIIADADDRMLAA